MDSQVAAYGPVMQQGSVLQPRLSAAIKSALASRPPLHNRASDGERTQPKKVAFRPHAQTIDYPLTDLTAEEWVAMYGVVKEERQKKEWQKKERQKKEKKTHRVRAEQGAI